MDVKSLIRFGEQPANPKPIPKPEPEPEEIVKFGMWLTGFNRKMIEQKLKEWRQNEISN